MPDVPRNAVSKHLLHMPSPLFFIANLCLKPQLFVVVHFQSSLCKPRLKLLPRDEATVRRWVCRILVRDVIVRAIDEHNLRGEAANRAAVAARLLFRPLDESVKEVEHCRCVLVLIRIDRNASLEQVDRRLLLAARASCASKFPRSVGNRVTGVLGVVLGVTVIIS